VSDAGRKAVEHPAMLFELAEFDLEEAVRYLRNAAEMHGIERRRQLAKVRSAMYDAERRVFDLQQIEERRK